MRWLFCRTPGRGIAFKPRITLGSVGGRLSFFRGLSLQLMHAANRGRLAQGGDSMRPEEWETGGAERRVRDPGSTSGRQVNGCGRSPRGWRHRFLNRDSQISGFWTREFTRFRSGGSLAADGAREVGAIEHGTGQVRPGKAGAAHRRPGERRAGQVRLAQLRLQQPPPPLLTVHEIMKERKTRRIKIPANESTPSHSGLICQPPIFCQS